ncbi:hypothetical protein D3C81_2211990 [compost metagenome]
MDRRSGVSDTDLREPFVQQGDGADAGEIFDRSKNAEGRGSSAAHQPYDRPYQRDGGVSE